MGRAGRISLALLAAAALVGCGGDDGGSTPAEDAAPDVDCEALADGTGPVEVRADWAEGDSFELVVETQRQDSAAPTDISASSPVTVRVDDVHPDGYGMTWQQRPVILSDQLLEQLDVPDDVLAEIEAASVLDARYEVDADGAFVRLLNTEELFQRFSALLDLVATADSAGELIELVESYRTNPDLRALVEGTFAADISSYHGLYGETVGVDEPVEATTRIPNPFGGAGTILGDRRVELVTAADEAGCAVLELTAQPEVDGLRRAVVEFLEEVAPEDQLAEGEVEALLADLEVQGTGRYVWDPGSTWMVEVETTEDTSVAVQERHEQTTFTAA